jgi:prepilin-type N-terminal cleavage/methylation domain-containing protein
MRREFRASGFRISEKEVHMHAKRRRLGFTLVELLVVIGIIAVLIGLLMPALSRARDSAKQVNCSSNLRQLYLGFVMYGNDNRQWLPGPNPDAQPWVMRGSWWSGGTGRFDLPLFAHNKLDRYVSAHSKVWLCPGWPENEPYDTSLVVGTPYNPTAGDMPSTPANMGLGYYYKPVLRQWFGWGGWDTWVMRFGKQKYPWNADMLCCLPAQNWANEYGPHARGKLWQNLFMDGSIRATAGLYGSKPNYSIVVNLPPDADSADWTPK